MDDKLDHGEKDRGSHPFGRGAREPANMRPAAHSIMKEHNQETDKNIDRKSHGAHTHCYIDVILFFHHKHIKFYSTREMRQAFLPTDGVRRHRLFRSDGIWYN